MATRLDAITTAYMLATSKSNLPAIGSSKRDLLTNLAVKFYRDWQTEPNTEWDSLYQVIGAGTVTATDTFNLDTAINFISKLEGNCVRVLCTDGTTYLDFTTVKPQQLYQYRYQNAVAHVVINGTHKLKFSKVFTSSDQAFGGAIQVPAIIKLDDITSDTSNILIDQPNWLDERIAAQYAYSFKSLRDMYPDLLDMANETMQSMKAANGSGNESTSDNIDYFATMGNVGIDY
jgi:hypothetical protein